MKSWDEMTELEQLACEYSDYYKDAYGFRPRNDVSLWTAEDYKKQFEQLSRVCRENEEERNKAEQAAVVSFEALVAKLISENGVKNRADAIRILMNAEGIDVNDKEYFCYCMGLPYGYFTQK
jgi:hypothetical protein